MATTSPRNILFIINDGPYGSERAYNALRLVLNLVKRPEAIVRVFLTGDGVVCAKKGQKTPDGFYNVERMLKALTRRGEVAL
jgi:uncharacterized protein involved in oxidation of intracellular sulfur